MSDFLDSLIPLTHHCHCEPKAWQSSTSKLFFLFCFLVFALCSQFSYSQSQAFEKIRFDTITAYPPQVAAGANITITASFVNITNEAWQPDDYSLYAEIYDSAKKLLTITDKVSGTIPLAPNQITSITITYDVPETYSGIFYYKIRFKYKDTDVKATDTDYSFEVISKIPQEKLQEIPQEKLQEKRKEISLNGLFNVSYTSEAAQGSSTNMPTNLSAIVGSDKTFALSGNLLYGGDFPSLQNYLFNYKSKNTETSVGFFYPSFSELTLSGIKAEGGIISVTGDKNQFPGNKENISILNARTIRANQTSNTYEQYLTGMRWCWESDQYNSLGISYIKTHDAVTSLLNVPMSSSPIKNSVVGIDLKTKPSRSTSFTLDYSQSAYDNNVVDNTASNKDEAYKMRFITQKAAGYFELTYRYTGADFYSVGASPQKDQKGFDFIGNYQLTNNILLNTSIGRYNSNIQKSLTKNSLNSTNRSFGLNISSKNFFPNLTFNYSNAYVKNGAVALTPTNYANNSLAFGMSKKMGGTDISLNFSRTDYKDNTQISHNTRTNSTNISLSSLFAKKYTITITLSDSKSSDLFDKSTTKSNVASFGLGNQPANNRFTYNLNLNLNKSSQSALTTKSHSLNFRTDYKLVPEKWNIATEWNISGTKNTTNTTNSKSTVNLFGLDYNITSNNTLSLEFRQNKTTDAVNPASSSSKSVFSARCMMKF